MPYKVFIFSIVVCFVVFVFIPMYIDASERLWHKRRGILYINEDWHGKHFSRKDFEIENYSEDWSGQHFDDHDFDSIIF